MKIIIIHYSNVISQQTEENSGNYKISETTESQICISRNSRVLYFYKFCFSEIFEIVWSRSTMFPYFWNSVITEKIERFRNMEFNYS